MYVDLGDLNNYGEKLEEIRYPKSREKKEHGKPTPSMI